MKTKDVRLCFAARDFELLHAHLFPGDGDEHGAVLKAGLVSLQNEIRLLVREVHIARPGSDYVAGTIGYRALAPSFIHKHIVACRNERLVYLAVHNHDSDDYVGFSHIDIESHERGYPALLDIAEGMPVGALVFGHRSIEADIWLPDKTRLSLTEARIIGRSIRRQFPRPHRSKKGQHETHDRQVRFFGQRGQRILSKTTVAIVGLGGVGSIVAEYLARIGVGKLVLVDPDRIEESNLSRVVGATLDDVRSRNLKVDIASKHLLESSPKPIVETIAGDAAQCSTAMKLREVDYIFLAADSMRARLVCNALVQQYFVPAVQMGAKITADGEGNLQDVMAANRPMRPGSGCLWCSGFIDSTALALEAKSDEERKEQAYGTEQPNPSVIALNAVAASHAVNDFLLDYLDLRQDPENAYFEHHHFLSNTLTKSIPRKDQACPECGRLQGARFGLGDARNLPCTT